MRILFLHSGRDVPSSRFRIQPFVQRFRQAGHHAVAWGSFPQKYSYFSWLGFRPSQMLKRMTRQWHWLKFIVGRFDVVVIERELFDSESDEMEIRFRKSAKRMVLDVDDAVFLRYPDKFARTAKSADLVVVGNRNLGEYVRPLNSSIVQIPTCVEMSRYTQKPRDADADSRPVIVGWMGTTGNLEALRVIADALRQVASKVQFTLKLIVPDLAPLRDVNLDGVQIEHHPWSAATEIQQLHSFDFGLMPIVPGRDWDQYKCGAKLIQYMAVGIPGIASPVGANCEIVSHGENGLLCSTTDEWTASLLQLIQNTKLRKRLGQAARATITNHYSVESTFPRLLAAFEELVN